MFYEAHEPTGRVLANQDLNQPRSGARMQPRACPELVEGAQALGNEVNDHRAPKGRKNNSGAWDTFSTRNLGLRINRRMSRGFNGDSQRIRQASTAAVTHALNLNPSRWTPLQKQSLENWSLVLSEIPNLSHWTRDEKEQLIKIIRSKSASTETPYLRQTQHHPRLRSELLRLGS
jgi:hypothetical protein